MRFLAPAARISAVVGLALLAFVMGGRFAPDVIPEKEVGHAGLGGTVEEPGAGRDEIRDAALHLITGSGTYLGAMLDAQDSVLRRWPERMEVPLAVYISRRPVPGYSSDAARAVQRAFSRWEQVGGIPVRFEFVPSAADADVHVVWIEKFPFPRTGQADIVWTHSGRILRATLTLATHSHEGAQLTPEAFYTIALHEVGHLLGIGHSDDPRDLMYALTEAGDLTLRDRETARLLYAIPPGPYGSAPAARP